RPAILWNDTRTTEECNDIYSTLGEERLLSITKNHALEGFTLPKLLWVQKHEPYIFEKIDTVLLPKDYVRYKLTNQCHMDYSDAAGTLLLDIVNHSWSDEICDVFQIPKKILPELVNSEELVGVLKSDIAHDVGLPLSVKVFAG